MNFNYPVYQNCTHFLIYISLHRGHVVGLRQVILLYFEKFLGNVLRVFSDHMGIFKVVSIDGCSLRIHDLGRSDTPEASESFFDANCWLG